MVVYWRCCGPQVVRGGPAFAVSLLISSIEPSLRNAAALGAWQVISPQEATGVVEVVHGLHEVQDKNYTTPTVLLANQVRVLCGVECVGGGGVLGVAWVCLAGGCGYGGMPLVCLR